MGELNTIPMRINKVEGAAGQVKLSGGPGAIETWGAPAPAAHIHAAGDVTSGQFPLARMPRAAAGNFLEGNGVAANPIYNALIATNIPVLAASKITSGQFPLDRMPRAASGVLTGKGAGVNPAYEAVPGAEALVASHMARAYNSANQAIGSGALEAVTLDTESYDIDGEFAANAFTTTIEGYYLIHSQLQITQLAADKYMWGQLRIDGVPCSSILGVHTSVQGDVAVNLTTIQHLTVGQVITVAVAHNHGANRNLLGNTVYTYLEVMLLAI